MSERRMAERLEAGRRYRVDGYRVVYAPSRAAVRAAVLGPCEVVLVETGAMAGPTEALRWTATMTRPTCVGALGPVPAGCESLVDVRLEGPATLSTLDRLIARVRERDAYLRRLDDYYRAVVRGDDERALATARDAIGEYGDRQPEGTLRGLFDAICV